MSSSYKNRIAALAAQVVGQRRFAPPRPPLFVIDGDVLPEAIRAARKQRRAIVYVYGASREAVEFVIDSEPDYVAWSTPQDCPISVKRFHANLATGEVVGPSFGEWMRPEALNLESEETNESQRY